MASQDGSVSRRSFLKRATTVSVGALASRGVYQALEEFGILRPASAYADTVTRPQEQYLVGNIGVILDNGVTVALPPIYNDVITAKLKSGRRWTTSALKTAQRRVENALGVVEQAYPATAAGLDRKSTRLNSSHEWISYAVFCLKTKKTNTKSTILTKTKNTTILPQQRPYDM